MSQTGDDCHFFYSSTCTKGDSCPFRHVEAAKSSTIICNFWKQKNCTKKDCPYRHSNIKGKSVPCYWENKPNGCTRADCTFQHFKPRPVQDGQVPSGNIPVVSSAVIEPIVVNPAEDSSDMDSPKKRPLDQSSATNEENVGGQSSGVQQISVIIQQNRANQMHRGKTFGQSNITPWKRSPFQQHMHKQQLMQQRKRQFQQRQQQHLQRQMHQSQQQQEVEPSTEKPEENEDDESQSDKQQESDVKRPQVDKENIKKPEKPVEKKDLPSHSSSKGKKTLTPVVPVKKIIKLRKDPKKEKPAPEPKKELPKIKKIIKKVVNSSEDDAGTDELGIKSLEQTLRERALRSMGIVEIIVKKDEKKQSDKTDEDQESDDEDNENSESEKQDATSDENEVEEGSEEEKSEEEGEGEEEQEVGSEEEEVGSEEGEEEEGRQEEEEEGDEEEDDLQDPEEIEILPVENMDQFTGNDEEQEDEDETKENENDSGVENEQEDTRKAVKKVSSTRLKKEREVSKKRESKIDKLKKKRADKQETDIGKSVPKRTVLDRLGRKVKQVSGISDKSERLDIGSRKSGNIIKLRRSSKSREELKLNSKNRIQPENSEMSYGTVGSTNSGTIRLASRHGDKDINEKGVRKSSSRTTNVKSRLGWNRPSDSTSETSDLSDSEKQIQQKRSVKNRLGWRNKDDIENVDSDHSSPTKDTKRKRSKSRKSGKKDKKDRYIRERDQYDSSEFSDSDSEGQLREKARKLKKLIDFDSDTIEDILRAKERKKKSKSKRKRRRREEELSEESDFSQEDQRKATFSKSRERNRLWESERKKEFVDEDEEYSDSVAVIPNKIPSSRHTGITFQVKNDLARRRMDQFTVDKENSDSDDNSVSKTKEFQEKLGLKRGWVKSAVNEAETQILTSDVAKKPKINRIEWGTDDKDGSEVIRKQNDVKTVVRPVVGRTNSSWSTRGSNNIRLVAGNDLKSKMDHLDQIGEEKVKHVQIKSLEEIRREKAQKYVSDDSSSEELDPMEALRQKFNVKSSGESSRQKIVDAKRKNRQAQQIYVPPPRKRTVQLAFDSVDDVSGGKKERVSSPVQSQAENQTRVSPVQFDMFDNKAQGTSKAEVKTFAEIMAEKRARAKQLRDQSSKAESQTQPCDKSSKSFKPIVFDIGTGSGSKSVSPTNRFVGTDRESPVTATTKENTENVNKDNDDSKTHKSHKHHHKAKKEKRRWRKKKSKMSPDEDETSQDTRLENSASNMSTEPSSSTIFTLDDNSLRPETDFSNFAVEVSSASKPEMLPVPEPVDIDEPEVTESVPQETLSKPAVKHSESDSWLDFDFGEDLDVSKDDNKDDDDLLREIDELLA